MKKYLFISIIITLNNIISFGQGLRYNVQADGFGNYSIKNKSFFIVPADKTISMKDLEFKEYSSYVSAILQLEGAIEATDFNKADLCILINYTITDKTYTETVPVPIRGVVGSVSNTYTNTTQNTNTYGSIYGNTYASAYGNSANAQGYANGNVSSNQNTNTSSSTYTSPVYGTIGYSNVSKTVTNYLRILNLYAYDNKITDEPEMLWKVNIRSEGSGSNLRTVIPILCWSMKGEAIGKKMSYDYYIFDRYDSVKYFTYAADNKDITTFLPIARTPELLIRYVFREEGKTSIVYFLKGEESIKIPKSIALETNGVRYPLERVNDNKITYRIHNSDKSWKAIKLTFPVILMPNDTISIVDGEAFSMPKFRIK